MIDIVLFYVDGPMKVKSTEVRMIIVRMYNYYCMVQLVLFKF